MFKRFAFVGLALGCLVFPLIAQENPEGHRVIEGFAAPEDTEAFGLGNSIHNLGPAAFTPRVAGWDTCQMWYASYWQPAPGPSSCFLGANFELPAGALLVSAVIYYGDSNATSGQNPSLSFTHTNTIGQNVEIASAAFPDNAPGNSSLTVNFPPDTTIDNLNRVYSVEMGLDPNTTFYRVRLIYRRQVSPAPGVATFPNDVPTTHPYFRFVEALAASGVTGGCGTGSYCPDMPVTRGQMAVFLAAALGLHFP
jgi:hypothetical protein